MRKSVKILLPSLAIFFIFCNNSAQKKGDIKYFEYYDLYSLKGIKPIEAGQQQYPFVTIDNLHDSIIITHFISSKDIYKSTYQINKGYLKRTLVDNHEERDNSKIEEYIHDKTIYILNYDLSTSLNRLASVAIFRNDTLVKYGLHEVVEGEFTPTSAMSLISKLKKGVIETTKFKLYTDSVFVESKAIGINDSAYHYGSNLKFPSFGKPLNWWFIYKWQTYLKSMNVTPKNLILLGVPETEL